MNSVLPRMALALIFSAACASSTAWAERRLDESHIVIEGQTHRYFHLHDEAVDSSLPAIVLIDGSGCRDQSGRLQAFFEKYPPGLDLYFLEKPGIVQGATGEGDPSKTCTPEYLKADYAQKRIADTVAFLEQEPQLRQHGHHSLALVGFSEGGKIAPYVAQANDKIGWLATGGAGAMRQGDGFLLFADHGVAPYAKPYSRRMLMREFAAIAKNPDDLDHEFFGHSYKYWNSHLFDDPLPIWAALDIHMVAAMGSKDESEPIEAGYRLRDYFAAHPGHDFQFVEYKGGAHNLKVGDKNNLQDFVADLAKWFRGERHPFAHD
ncbi:MAG TPA: hypothetical protein VF472_25835 [Burkholderiaceae bacterium]